MVDREYLGIFLLLCVIQVYLIKTSRLKDLERWNRIFNEAYAWVYVVSYVVLFSFVRFGKSTRNVIEHRQWVAIECHDTRLTYSYKGIGTQVQAFPQKHHQDSRRRQRHQASLA